MPMIEQGVASEQLIEHAIDAMESVKGKSISLLDLREIENAVTDFFVITTGTSRTHVDALARAVERNIAKRLRQKPWHVEGVQHSEWILLDYVDVVVHVFQAETRTYYDLEGLWGDATISERSTQL